MKKTDLFKNAGLKINSKVHESGDPVRFGAAATAVPDRREQRKLDQAAGLVPFATKLNSALVADLHALAKAREVSMPVLIDDLLRQAMSK